MKRILLFLLLIGNICHSQNYQCFQAGAKNYFTNEYGYLRGIRIDSVNTHTDYAEYFPYHTPRGRLSTSSTILDSNGGSWLGKRVIELNDGRFLFDNIWHDTVVINTRANTGDNWVFYNDSSTCYYMATMIAKDTMTVLGVIDSIKRILITAFDTSGHIITDLVDSFELKLSKNHGFVQVFDLYTFPYHAPNAFYGMNTDYYLQSITFPNIPDLPIHLYSYSMQPEKHNSTFRIIPYSNPSPNDLTRLHVGDVIEYSSCLGYGGLELPSGNCDPPHRYDLDTIISIDSTGGIFTYTYTGWRATLLSYSFTGTSPNPVFTYRANSGAFSFSHNPVFDTILMPEEFMNSDLQFIFQDDTSFCVNGLSYGTCRSRIEGHRYYPPFEDFGPINLYKYPFGLLVNNTSNLGSYGYIVTGQKLIYYNGCGHITLPTNGVNDPIANANSVQLYPNPAHNRLSIASTLAQTNISITNLFGQTMLTHSMTNGVEELDIESLSPGLYLVRINDVVVRKLVKE